MDIKQLQDNWNRFGVKDPLWAVLSDPAKKGGRWAPAGFFETGRAEIAQVMGYLQSLPIQPKLGRALDFGCGVGRLTQALCDHFAECHGVDIAPSMLELAQRYNRHGAKAHYHLNAHPDLSLFEADAFDFIYSNLVLQHMQPEYSAGYIREFFRVLKPGGIVLFQLPSEANASSLKPGLTGDAQALPPSGFNARIRMDKVSSTVQAGSQLEVAAQVTNLSDVAWPTTWAPNGRYLIRLGNHWLDARGRTILNDDGRTAVPREVKPGEVVDMLLTVRVPAENGTYLLELDMVQEQVAWFQSRGSATARARVNVKGGVARPVSDVATGASAGRLREWLSRLARPLTPQEPEPVMEMYGTPRPEVIELIESAGGRLVEVQRYDVAGEEWVSYRYCATK